MSTYLYTFAVPATYSDIAPIPKQMTILIGLCVVGLMAFGLALSYYKNILFDRQLLSMQERNNRLKREIMDGYGQLQYLQSTQYRDKYAKEYLGLLSPGENVLILHTPAEPVLFSKETELTGEDKQAIYEENLRNIRIIDHWKLFLFNRDKIDELKKEV